MSKKQRAQTANNEAFDILESGIELNPWDAAALDRLLADLDGGDKELN
jgi:hypothetical protein